MYSEIVGCCKKPTLWIFIYKNDIVYSICQDHFYSIAHRYDVKDVINFQTLIHYDPKIIFKEHPISFPCPQEHLQIV